MAKASKRPAKFGNSAIRASRRFTTSSAFETQPRPCRQTQSRGDLRIRTGDPRHGRERRGDRAVEGRPFVRLAIPAHRVTLQAIGFTIRRGEAAPERIGNRHLARFSKQDFSGWRRLRGGAGRTRTNHQSVMEYGVLDQLTRSNTMHSNSKNRY